MDNTATSFEHVASSAREGTQPLDGVFVQAGLWLRALGFTLDLVLVAIIVRVLVQPVGALLVELFLWEHVYASYGDALSVVLFSPTLFFYYVLLEGRFGRTAGKWATGTQVITENKQRPKWLVVLARTAIRFVPFEFASIYLSTERRSWHDLLSATYVVVRRP